LIFHIAKARHDLITITLKGVFTETRKKNFMSESLSEKPFCFYLE